MLVGVAAEGRVSTATTKDEMLPPEVRAEFKRQGDKPEDGIEDGDFLVWVEQGQVCIQCGACRAENLIRISKLDIDSQHPAHREPYIALRRATEADRMAKLGDTCDECRNLWPLAEALFDAYNAQGPSPGKTWDGKPVPPFQDCGSQVRGKWLAAAREAQDRILAGADEP